MLGHGLRASLSDNFLRGAQHSASRQTATLLKTTSARKGPAGHRHNTACGVLKVTAEPFCATKERLTTPRSALRFGCVIAFVMHTQSGRGCVVSCSQRLVCHCFHFVMATARSDSCLVHQPLPEARTRLCFVGRSRRSVGCTPAPSFLHQRSHVSYSKWQAV